MILCIGTSTLAENVLVGADARAALGMTVPQNRWTNGGVEEWPEKIWRELEFARHRSIECTKATNRLIEREALVHSAPETELPDKLVTLRDYVEACLVPLEAVSDPEGGYRGRNPQHSKFLLHVLGEEQVEVLKQSIFLIPGIVGKPCSGIIVKIPGKPEQLGFLTAAHCLGSVWNEIENGSNHMMIGVSRRLLLDHISGDRYQIEIKNINRVFNIDPTKDDIALVMLPRGFVNGKGGLEVASMSLDPFEHLYIIGQNELLREYRDLNFARQGLEPPVVTHNTTITMGALCRAHGQIRAVLLHNCQTRFGSSGGALVTMSNGALRVIGVHAGNRLAGGYRGFLDTTDMLILDESKAVNFGILLGELVRTHMD